MIKRAMMIGALSLSLVTMLDRDAEAHLAGTVLIGGYLRHVASLACGITVKGVPNPDTNPSALTCTATITEVEFLCENPTSHQVNPGQSARRTVVVSTAEFNDDNIDKKKGVGTAEAHIDTGFVVTNEDCVNPNWHVVPDSVIVQQVQVQYDTVECTGSDPTPCSSSVLAYREVKDCALQSGFGYDKGESGAPPENTEYTCNLLSRDHVR